MSKAPDYTSDIVALHDMLDIPHINPSSDFFHHVAEHVVDAVRALITDPDKLICAQALKSAEIKKHRYDETKGPDSFVRLYNTVLDYTMRAHLAENGGEIGSGFRSIFNGLLAKKTFDPNMKVDPGYLLLRTMYSYALHPRTAIGDAGVDDILFDPEIPEENKAALLERHSKEIMTKAVKDWILLLQDHPNAANIKKTTYEFVAKMAYHESMAVKYSDGTFSKRLLPVMEELMPEIKAAEMLRRAAAREKAAERLCQLASLSAAQRPRPSAQAPL